jgi:CubicO group peptidase (beta-lactamase class C family)
VRCPIPGGETDFGWDGAAGSYMAIERELGLSVFYATHLLNPPIAGPRLQIIDLLKKALT